MTLLLVDPEVGERKIGPGEPVFIVAEISCNHAGSLRRARALVRAAARAGADAVKFQAYTAREITCDSERPAYRIPRGPWAGRRLFDLYTEAATPYEWLPELFRLARDRGLYPFASVFGRPGLAAVRELRPALYKVASAEVTDAGLVEMIAGEGTPVVLSDGMATAEQLATALDILDGGDRAALLHCVSAYPAAPESYRLKLIRGLVESGTTMPVGLSDHTRGSTVAVAAVALGASVVEKHLMLPRWRYWARPLDAGHSEEPRDFAATVEAIRKAEGAMRGPAEVGRSAKAGAAWRRRLVFAHGIGRGRVLTEADVMTRRAGLGLEPDRLRSVIGQRLTVDVRRGDPVVEEAWR